MKDFFALPPEILNRVNVGSDKYLTTLPIEEFEVFKENGQGLYMWVSLSQYKLIHKKIEEESRIKFGQYGSDALMGSTPQVTIDGYSWLTEPRVIIWVKKLNKAQIKKFESAKKLEIDKVRKTLISSGVEIYKDGDGKETYKTTASRILEVVNSFLYSTEKNLQSFEPRKRQLEYIAKAKKSRIADGSDIFLLAAIMRYGKNFSWLRLNKELMDEGYVPKNSVFLVLTSKPKVFSSIKEDIQNHINFHKWEYFELKDVKDRKNVKVNPNVPTVIAVSTQLVYNKLKGRETRKFLKSLPYEDVFIDECHSGTNTENFQTLLGDINTTHQTWASGTPIKTFVTGGFTNKNSYFYGYIDQQTDKENDLLLGIPNDSVTLETYIPLVPDKIKNNPLYHEDEQFSITKLLAVGKDGKFLYDGDVEYFILAIFGKGKAKFSPYRTVSRLNHTVWLLPHSVDVATAFCKLLKKLVGDTYEIVNATGDNETEITAVENAVQKPKSITITIGRFVEGVTVKPWTGAFVLSDTKSPERYFQFIFRVASPDEGKTEAYVFDFSPQRTFEMTFEMAKSHAVVNGEKDISKVVKRWLDCNNIYCADEESPEFRSVDVRDIMNEINNGDYRAQSLKSTARNWVDFERLREFKDKFAGLNIKNTPKVSKDFIDNKMGGGKNYNLSGRANSKPTTKKEVDELKKAIENVAGIVSSLPYLSDLYEVETVSALFETIDEDVFVDMTSVPLSLGKLLVDKEIINEFEVNFYL